MAEKKPLWLQLYGTLRDARDRALHPWRQRRALLKLANRTIRSVYFVCEGNIYRSPFAARVFLSIVPDTLPPMVRVGSGGFVGPLRPSPSEAVASAGTFGIDLTSHRSTLLMEALQQDWDLIVVMEPRHRRTLNSLGVSRDRILVLGDLDGEFADQRAIPDPWQHEESLLQTSYARIDRCVRALAGVIANGPGSRGGQLPADATPTPDMDAISLH